MIVDNPSPNSSPVKTKAISLFVESLLTIAPCEKVKSSLGCASIFEKRKQKKRIIKSWQVLKQNCSLNHFITIYKDNNVRCVIKFTGSNSKAIALCTIPLFCSFNEEV
jgi:hypothetical protein